MADQRETPSAATPDTPSGTPDPSPSRDSSGERAIIVLVAMVVLFFMVAVVALFFVAIRH